MSSAANPFLKPLSMADACRTCLPAQFTTKTSYPFLAITSKPIKLHISCSSTSLFLSTYLLKRKNPSSPLISSVAQTSDWAQQDGENTLTEERKVEEGELNWENEEDGEIEATISDWESEGQEGGESGGEEDFVKGSEEESYPEPPEDAKIFVGNLPYDIDSEKLAQLFDQAGVVEVAEVIYNRETDQSRGFGFVTMSTVEEADKAVELFHRYDLDGRLLTVNKAAPKGARPERPSRVFEPAFRIYVGNLPWQVDNARLEQVFSEHGKVVDARVVFDRETGRSRGFGFVTMSSESELNDAIAALDGESLDGRPIRVSVAEDRPRRNSF